MPPASTRAASRQKAEEAAQAVDEAERALAKYKAEIDRLG
jgi:hypothetical protein